MAPYWVMGKFSWLIVAIALLSLLGCGKAGVVGKWQATVAADPGHENDPAFALEKAMMSTVNFELKPDGTFTGNILFPVEGTYTVAGSQVSLRVTKAMGQTVTPKPEDKPIVCEISGDGKTLTASHLDSKSDKDEHFHLTLTRQG
jgi:hypothetical protein